MQVMGNLCWLALGGKYLHQGAHLGLWGASAWSFWKWGSYDYMTTNSCSSLCHSQTTQMLRMPQRTLVCRRKEGLLTKPT
jgi:hypothetical protein